MKPYPWSNIRKTARTDAVLKSRHELKSSVKAYFLKDLNEDAGLLLEFHSSSGLEHIDKAPKLENIEYEVDLVRRHILIFLRDKSAEKEFYILCRDILETLEKRNNDAVDENVAQIINTLVKWRRLFMRQESGMSKSVAIGLWGELHVMLNILEPIIGISDAIRAWSGPTGGEQDFGWKKILVEVKTSTATHDRVIEISSLDQLDIASGRIVLAVLSVLASSKHSSGAASINDLILKIRDISGITESDLLSLEGNLLAVGYDEKLDQVNEPYEFNELMFFDIDEDFPALTRKNVPIEIKSCRYNLELSLLSQWKLEEEALIKEISDAVN